MKYHLHAVLPLLLPGLAHGAEIIETVAGPVAGTGDGVVILDHNNDTGDWITSNPFEFGGNGISLEDAGASGTYYFAFDWVVTDNGGEAASGSGFFGGLGIHRVSGGNQVRGLAGNPWTGRFFGMGEVGGDVNSTVEYQVGVTARIVLHVTFNPNAPDNIVMYVDPPESDPFVEGDPSGITSISVNDDWSFNTLLSRANGPAEIGNLEVAIPGFVTPAVATWDGDAGWDWATAANWENDTLPEENDVLFFGESFETILNNDLSAGFLAGGLSFGSFAPSYELAGNPISFSGPIINGSFSTQFLGFPIELTGDLEVATTSASLHLGGVISGPHGLVKTGGGIVELFAENTYTGDTAVSGTLTIGDGATAGSIDPAGTVVFGSGVNNHLEFNRADDVTFSNPVVTGGRANIATLSAGTVTLDNAITGGGEFWTSGHVIVEPHAGSAARGSSNVIASGTLEISHLGPETLGTGNFYVAQSGEGTVRYTGPTASTNRFTWWTLQGTGSNTFFEIVEETTDLTLTSSLHGGDVRGFTKTGAGTLTLAAPPNYQGDTLVNGGVLSLQQSGLSDQSTVRVAGGAILDLDYAGSDSISGLILGGEVQEAGIYGAATHSEFFTGSGSLEVLSSDLSPTLTWDGGGAGDNWSTAANWSPDAVPGAGDILAFGGAGGTTVNDLPPGTPVGGLVFPLGGGSYEISGNSIILSGAIQNNAGAPQTIALPVELGSNLHLNTGNSTVTIDAPVSGSSGLTITGGGRVELPADNSYTGRTAITGTLATGDGGSGGGLAAASVIGFGAGTGNRLEILRTDGTTLANPIETGGRAHVGTVGGGTVTVTGPITGAGEFWTFGNVVVTPDAASSSRDSTNVIASGVLEVIDFTSATLGTGNYCIGQAGSGTLRYTGPGETTGRIAGWALQASGSDSVIEIANPAAELIISGAIGDVGGNGLTKSGPGTLTLAAVPTYNGITVVEEGTLSLLQISLRDEQPVRIATGAKLDLSFSGSDTVAGLILGEAAQGPGTYSAATHGEFISGSGSLFIPGATGGAFETWIGTFSQLADPADKSGGADPDKDGLSNLEEFAFDGHPASGAADGKTAPGIHDGHLTLTLPVRAGTTFSGSGPLTATLDGVRYTVRGGIDLGTFESEVIELESPLSAGLPDLSSGWEYRTFQLSTPVAGAPRGFLHASAVSAP